MAVLRAVRRAAAVLFLLAAATPRVAGFSSYGDRPGQLRRVRPRFWPLLNGRLNGGTFSERIRLIAVPACAWSWGSG